MEKKEIIYKSYFNIGVAVDTEFGLIVPVIKNSDKKSLTEISVDMNALAEKARNKKSGWMIYKVGVLQYQILAESAEHILLRL